jgi:tetratricopeptide (TPR) repeat protein
MLGCIQSQKIIPPSAVPPDAKIVKAEDMPKKTPKPDTYVAFANLRLHAAMDGSAQGDSREEALTQARKLFEQAVKADPKCAEAYKGLALVEQTKGNYDGALDYFRKAIAVDPKASQPWYELGVCQARHGNWPAAVESIQQATNLDNENRAYVKTLGFCLAKNGRCDDSVACFMRIMDEGLARYNVARMLHYEKQDDLSRGQLVLAIQVNPKLAAAQDLLAQLDGRSSPTNPSLAAGSGPSVAIDIDDVAAEVSATPGSAN